MGVFLVTPLQGSLINRGYSYPRALPWALMYCPYRARMPEASVAG